MSGWFADRAPLFALAALIALLFGTRSAIAQPDPLERVARSLASARVEEARERFEELSPERARSPRGRYLAGRLAFYEGRFDAALDELRAAIEGARAEASWRVLRDRVALTRETLADLERVAGPSGAFVYRHEAGADALLPEYAEQTLVAQLEALVEVLGDRPRAPIEVDFLPDAEALAACSGLTVEQIERTGTVAVSKYGRVMLLTPRALAAGYPWLDTLAHELVHVMVTRVSADRAPIWLHEGLAKMLERRWRGEAVGALTPPEAYLLDRAARERRLIPLRRFHPSVAHLPNQEDAALAYAQVLSFLAYLDERLEEGWIRRLLEELAAGASFEDGFAEVSRFALEKHFVWWRQSVSGTRQTPVPAVALMERRYRLGAAADRGPEEAALDLEVRRHLRIGDLLRLRGHLAAAAIEFRRAQSLADSPSPLIGDRLAGTLLETGDHEAVAEVAGRIADLYPHHATALVQLGRARFALGQLERAAAALERANGLNPFAPRVHCVLAEVYERLGRVERLEREQAGCRLLAAAEGRPPAAAP